MSLRPRFADALLAGTKTVEIRRQRVRIADGSLCLLYASSPVRALVGAVRIERTMIDTAEAIWNRWGDRAGLSRLEYDSYLDGCALSCAIVIAAATRLTDPITLNELRQRQDAFVTPQSYRFLKAGELASITNGQVGQLRQLSVANVPSSLRLSGVLRNVPSDGASSRYEGKPSRRTELGVRGPN